MDQLYPLVIAVPLLTAAAMLAARPLLEKQRLVRSSRDKSDSRKRLVHLTPKGQDLIERMKPVWRQMSLVLTDLTDTPHPLLPALDEVERRLQKESFLERATRLP